MDDDKADYEVGYGKPPKEHQFQKGRSGNVSGRAKAKKPEDIDVGEILSELVEVKQGTAKKQMHPYEVSIRQLAKRALSGDLRAIKKYIRLCEEFGVITPPPQITGGGVVTAPPGVDFHEWLDNVTEVVPIDET